MSKKELCRRESAVSSFSEAAKALHKDICTGEPGGATLMLVMRQTHIEFAKLILYQIRWRAERLATEKRKVWPLSLFISACIR